ncbi:MAG: Rrf2 family transcriptional regulator [Eubacteriales bacterium]|nr:Rrf2 family transcriptional regulator [Eubacteriales bacterium]
MQFSSRLTIAIHTMLCIENFKNEYKTTSTFLAGSVNVNPVIIRNILQKLKSAGLVTVEAGVGGASLAKDPKDITMLDVFEAVETEEDLFHFHENPNPECPIGKNVHALLDDKLASVKLAMENSMRSVTLQSLLDQMYATEKDKP